MWCICARETQTAPSSDGLMTLGATQCHRIALPPLARPSRQTAAAGRCKQTTATCVTPIGVWTVATLIPA